MSHIFISYSRKDIKVASNIVEALAKHKLETWIDWNSIPKGEAWEQAIYRGIEEADVFLFLTSPDSVASAMCNKEIQHAVKNGKRILPIILRQPDSSSIPHEIAKLNWIFCREGQDDFKKSIQDTLTTIQTDYKWLKYHTQLQVKALDWERNQDSSRLLRGRELQEAARQLAVSELQRDPPPTGLQNQFILASQRNEIRTRRRVIIGLALGLAGMFLLAVFAWDQRNNAVSQQATAQAASTSAVAQAEESRRQAGIALARQLAAQAELELQGGQPERGVLLALRALDNLPYTSQAELALGTAVMQSRGRLILSGHTDRVLSASWSPNGKFLVSASADGTARIWDADQGTELFVLEHPSGVNDADWSADGSIIATACDDSIIRIWNAANGKLLLQFNGQLAPLHSVTWAPMGTAVAITSGQDCNNDCSEDTLVQLWDGRNGDFLGQFSEHSSIVTDAAWSPDGELIVSASRGVDRSVRVWQVSSGKELKLIEGFEGDVTSVNWSPDGSRIVAGDLNGPVRVLDSSTGKELLTLEEEAGLRSSSLSVDWSPDATRIVGTGFNTIRIWNAFTGEEQLQFRGHSGGINHVEWSPDGKRIVSAGSDTTIRVWDAAPGPEVMRLASDIVYSALTAWSPDSEYLVTSWSAEAQVWEMSTQRQLFTVSTHTNNLDDLAWSPDGARIASLGWDPMVAAADLSIWDARTGEKLLTMNGHTFFVSGLAWSPDGTRIVTTSADTTAIIWDANRGTELRTITHPNEVTGVAWSPDGDQLVTTCLDNIGRIWDAASGEKLLELDGALGSVTWSPDGTLLLSSSENNAAIIWDASTGKEIRRLQGQTGGVSSVAWSPNGQRIVTGSNDRTARIWDASNGSLVMILSEHTSNVTSVSWSPNGALLATGSFDGTVKIWRVWETTQDLISYAQACCAIRELDAEERQLFNVP